MNASHAPQGGAVFGDPQLTEALDRIARAPVLLVATDFDGTLAPIVEDPASARPLREAVVALHELAGTPATHVAVISGRALAELARLLAPIDGIHLVGSHGSEYDLGFAEALSTEQRALRAELERRLQAVVARFPGTQLETKPAAVVFHYRRAAAPESELERAALAAVRDLEGIHLRYGKKVIELAVVHTDKGEAVERFRSRVGASAVLYLGDDLTDEDVFRRLRGPDVAIKVADGPSRAPFRVADPTEAARVLAYLAEQRAAWAAGADAPPIEEHAFLSDHRTVALVTPAGDISWLPVPRIDSSAIFAALLGGPTAGRFGIRPVDRLEPIRREYDGDTFVLRTVWPECVVIDYLDLSGERAWHRAGRVDLVRIVEGRGRVRIEFAPRFDFGRVPTRLEVASEGLRVLGGPEPAVLRAPEIRWEIRTEGEHETAVAEVELGEAPLVLEFRYGTARLAATPLREDERRRLTEEHWRRWVAGLVVPPVVPDLVRRSALVLWSLVQVPTGGIAAAGTTSLPEHIGGVRNWDYRYVWLRDGAMAARALVRLGRQQEAFGFLNWLLDILDRTSGPESLHPVYTVAGGHLGPEAELSHLAGYRGSRPVRIGNAAAGQLQLDVFGAVVELVAELAERGALVGPEHWRVTRAMVEAIEARWREPDHGIWEVRTQRRHFTHSKVMCWVAVDRALTIAEQVMDRRIRAWETLRDEIAADILAHAWKPELGAFSACYERAELDAAVLLIGLKGLVAKDDPRWMATIERIGAELARGPVLDRYRYDDGLPGREGGFILCAAWFVEALLSLGRIDEAVDRFRAWVGTRGPLGLFTEEYDPERRLGLGNYPQVYSHLGLIENALALAAAGVRFT